MPRTMGRVSAAGLLAAALLVGAGGPGVADPPDELPPPARADRDGDGVSDDLAHVLRETAPDDPIDVLVSLAPGARGADVARGAGVGLRADLPSARAFATTVPAAAVRGLADARGVTRISLDAIVTVQLEDARRDSGATAAQEWYPDVDGSGVGICVIDTGADPGHEQLDGAKIVAGRDTITDTDVSPADLVDPHGHGTHVAAIAAGDGTGGAQAAAHAGFAPGADLYIARALDAQGRGTETDIIEAIQWCNAQAGVDIISMSLGTSLGSAGDTPLDVAADNAAATDLVVVAAGNSGDDPQSVGSPGAAEDAITVGAIANRTGPTEVSAPSWYGDVLRHGQYLAPFSSRGPTLATDANGNGRRVKPDVVAPGVFVSSALAGTSAGYASYSGTSMATPAVAGALALALDASVATNAALEQALYDTAHDRGPAGKDDDWGHGVMDVLGLLQQVQGVTPVTPYPTPHTGASGSVSGSATWVHPFTVDPQDLGGPIAAAITIDESLEEVCYLWLCFEEWVVPDLDARLRDPAGNVVDVSGCPIGCIPNQESSVAPREILTWVADVAGTWTVEVYSWDGTPGTFTLDLTVGGATDPAPPPEPPPPPGPISFGVTVTDAASAGGAAASAWWPRGDVSVAGPPPGKGGGGGNGGGGAGGSWSATARIATTLAVVGGVTVDGEWTSSAFKRPKTASCVTDAAGTCDIALLDITKKATTVTFAVTDVTAPAGAEWNGDTGSPVVFTAPG